MRTPSCLDDTWKRRVAQSVLMSLTDARCQRSVYLSVCLSVCLSLHAVLRSLVTRFAV